MKIFLIRHGQSTGDVENRYGGRYDDHLTDEGKIQAESLAKKLQAKQIKKIFYSPLYRAKETALILQRVSGSELEEVPQLRERNKYGILTGMSKADAQKVYPQLVALLENDHNTIMDAEPFDEFKQRILTTFYKLSASASETNAIVTHGGPIKVILADIFEKKVKSIGDCAYIELEMTKNGFSLQKVDGVSFLIV